MSQTLYFLTGSSATGKTALSLDWACENGAEILSCDSLLVYRGMNIGTAKPTAQQIRRVKHHGINICPASVPYNVVRYMEMAAAAISDMQKRGRRVLIVGGSGFYLKSFFTPVVDELKISGEVADGVDELFQKEGLAGLVEELKRLNPEGCGSVDLKNPRRVVNSLRRCLASGKTVDQLNREFSQIPAPFSNFEKRVCCLWREKEEIKTRVQIRAHEMLRDGLLEEVRALLDDGIEKNPSAASAIGYRECIEYLKEGGTNRGDLSDTIARNTMRLVKKQRTWFKKQIPVERLLQLKEKEKKPIEALFD